MITERASAGKEVGFVRSLSGEDGQEKTCETGEDKGGGKSMFIGGGKGKLNPKISRLVKATAAIKKIAKKRPRKNARRLQEEAKGRGACLSSGLGKGLRGPQKNKRDQERANFTLFHRKRGKPRGSF